MKLQYDKLVSSVAFKFDSRRYGQAIPNNIDKVTNFRSDAKFVLLVEKDAAFMARP